MEYKEICDEVLQLRNRIVGLERSLETYKLKPLLEQCVALIEQADADTPARQIDRLDVYTMVAEGYAMSGRMALAVEYYQKAIVIAQKQIDAGRGYPLLQDLYESMIDQRVQLDGGDCQDLAEPMRRYLGRDSEDIRMQAVSYGHTAPKHDPVEGTAGYLDIIDQMEEKVAARLAKQPKDIDYAPKYWAAKKAILKDEYGIDWQSPAELNPDLAI